MIRGTTPTLEFTLPFSTDLIDEAYITVAQYKKPVFEKAKSDCTLNGNTISVKLTQEETLKLKAGAKVEMQIRCLTTTNDAIASEIIVCDAERILKDGEI